jgi:hypothetical protein
MGNRFVNFLRFKTPTMRRSVWRAPRVQFQTCCILCAVTFLRYSWDRRVGVPLVQCPCHLLVSWSHCLFVVCLYVTMIHLWCVLQAESLATSFSLAYYYVTVWHSHWFCVPLMLSVEYKGMWLSSWYSCISFVSSSVWFSSPRVQCHLVYQHRVKKTFL